jgi:hypothetical protein
MDENVRVGVIQGLRAAGYDATATVEMSLRGATDLEQI